MTDEDRLNAIERELDEAQRWRDGIDQERLLSRSQRENLLFRVALLEKLVWAACGLVLLSVAYQILAILNLR